MKQTFEKGKKYEPVHEHWPETSDAYFLGRLGDGDEVFAIVKDGHLVGCEIAYKDEVLAAPVNEGISEGQYLMNMLKGEKQAVEGERYELAGVAYEMARVLSMVRKARED